MIKGQLPKLSSSICNVPVESNCILLNGVETNSIILVKLKRKLCFPGCVYFQAVSPELIRCALLYLKENNPFFCDIQIDVANIPESLTNLTQKMRKTFGIKSSFNTFLKRSLKKRAYQYWNC